MTTRSPSKGTTSAGTPSFQIQCSEALPGAGPEGALVVVRQAGVRALGLTLAVLFCLLAWRCRRALSGRWGFRLLMLWLACSFLALFWLPPALRDAAWWPALAGSVVALLWCSPTTCCLKAMWADRSART